MGNGDSENNDWISKLRFLEIEMTDFTMITFLLYFYYRYSSFSLAAVCEH
jgi:hypothetical protein